MKPDVIERESDNYLILDGLAHHWSTVNLDLTGHIERQQSKERKCQKCDDHVQQLFYAQVVTLAVARRRFSLSAKPT